MTDLQEALEAALSGGPTRHHEKSEQQGKLPVRERVARLLDPESFAEEALLANWELDGFGADGVVTGLGAIAGGRWRSWPMTRRSRRARGGRRPSRRSSGSRSRRSSMKSR